MKDRVRLTCLVAVDATNVETNAHTVLGKGVHSMTPLMRPWEKGQRRLWLVHEKTKVGVLWEIIKNDTNCQVDDPGNLLS